MAGISKILKLKKEGGNEVKTKVEKSTQKEKKKVDKSNDNTSESTSGRCISKRWVLPLQYEDLYEVDRPTLGRYVDVVVFRAFALSIIKYLGFNSIHKIYHAGEDFGRSLGVKTIDELIECFKYLRIGVLEVVEENPIRIRVYESVFCSGFPNIGECVCHYERGILAGCFENILRKKVEVIETKCCACGDDYCEFEIRVIGDLTT
ncbi:MAG TPA: hypothetical protein EYH15_01275 [Methanothermococcus okinawensis]|uniref:4-vinyl reductase 4VR domain-containing protein n=1 Tax=Methanothermococcus okinawensis TaxID=155863 RepID=A0A833E4D4_9EURY|nr:hypothetical protein [Methanococcaceae archaeon]HIP84111.1 hypothetical protein [Methanothermococcus okinawensis]HIP91657.1 hypothetical protein [Methanothermococcus okinawensis]